MRNKKDGKQVIKVLGNLLMIIAVVFIIKKMSSLDIDYSILMNTRSLSGMLFLSGIYGMVIVIYGWPWRNYVNMISGVKLSYFPVAFVMAKSNLFKYIPGNVFQYVGRNELAVRHNLNHAEVGMATFFDVFTNLLAAGILGCIFYFEGFCRILRQFGNQLVLIILAGIIAVVLLGTLLWKKKRRFVDRYIALISSKKNLIIIMKNLVFYAVNMLVNAGLYIITVCVVLGTTLDISEIYIIMGAYILAWIIGFVVPGAPGGIGIREFVMTLLIPGSVNSEVIMLGLVVYRLVNIIGDLFGFVFTYLIKNVTCKEECI